MTISPKYFELTSDDRLTNFITRVSEKINNNTATIGDIRKAIAAEAEATARGLKVEPIVKIERV